MIPAQTDYTYEEVTGISDVLPLVFFSARTTGETFEACPEYPNHCKSGENESCGMNPDFS